MKTKAGLIPYYISDKIYFCLMISSDPAYGGPGPQLSKGHVEPKESTEVAAIREAQEELGFKISNAKTRPFKVFSNKQEGMIESFFIEYYAVEVKDSLDFSKPHFETERIVWISEDKIHTIRKSQQQILTTVLGIVKNKRTVDKS